MIIKVMRFVLLTCSCHSYGLCENVAIAKDTAFAMRSHVYKMMFVTTQYEQDYRHIKQLDTYFKYKFTGSSIPFR